MLFPKNKKDAVFFYRMNFILGHFSINEVCSFKMCHVLDHFYRASCQRAPSKFVLSKFGVYIAGGIHAYGSFKTTQQMLYSK